MTRQASVCDLGLAHGADDGNQTRATRRRFTARPARTAVVPPSTCSPTWPRTRSRRDTHDPRPAGGRLPAAAPPLSPAPPFGTTPTTHPAPAVHEREGLLVGPVRRTPGGRRRHTSIDSASTRRSRHWRSADPSSPGRSASTPSTSRAAKPAGSGTGQPETSADNRVVSPSPASAVLHPLSRATESPPRHGMAGRSAEPLPPAGTGRIAPT